MFLDANLRIKMFTPPIAELFNITKADIGVTITDFTHRLEYDGIEADTGRVLQDLVPVENEVPQPGRAMVHDAAQTLPHRGGSHRRHRHDLRRHYRASQSRGAQSRSEQQLRALVQASSQVLYRMSPAWDMMHELSGGGFLSDTDDPDQSWVTRYIPEEDQAQVRAEIEAANAAKRSFDLEHRVRRLDGTVGWTHSRAIPVFDGDGNIIEWFGSATDVTTRKTR